MFRFGKIFLILLPLIACGCIETTHEIVVNKNGGGRIIEKFMISKAALEKIAGLFAAFPDAEGAKPKKTKKMDMYDKKKLVSDAASYGPGVKYVSSKKVSTANQEGYEVVYAFSDINNLHINQNPSDKGPNASEAKTKADEENISFKFEKGSPSILTVIFPKQDNFSKEKKGKKTKKAKAPSQEEFDEMREIFKDMYIGIAVRPEGKIVETNATYNDNGKITLLEMDFDKLTADEEQFRSFVQKEPKTVEESKELLSKLPGFKVELNKEVTIKFE